MTVCIVPDYLIVVPLHIEQDETPEQHEAAHAEEGEPHGVGGVDRSPYPALLLLKSMYLSFPPRQLLPSFLHRKIIVILQESLFCIGYQLS